MLSVHTKHQNKTAAVERDDINPCIPSPCGPNSQCRAIGNQPACSCAVGYIGRPPSCRPECTINADCASNKACINERCVDPCQSNVCAVNAYCSVVNHNAICNCNTGYEGDAFTRCTLIIVTRKISLFLSIRIYYYYFFWNLVINCKLNVHQ